MHDKNLEKLKINKMIIILIGLFLILNIGFVFGAESCTIKCGGPDPFCYSPTGGSVPPGYCCCGGAMAGCCDPSCCGCTPSWTCTAWGTCTGSPGIQYRTCTDSNHCGTTSGKPAESQSCTVPPCTPETDAQFCARLGKVCGSVTANDNCGNSRTVASCGACDNGKCEKCTNNQCVFSSNCGNWCCQKEEKCCADKVCCNNKIYECGSKYGFNFCKAINCKAPEPVKCGDVCCPEGSLCGKTGVKDACMSNGCAAGTTLCAKDGTKTLCCKSNENCISFNLGIKACIPFSCETGKTLCPGYGKYSLIKKCCPIATATCGKHPSDYPRCIEKTPASAFPAGTTIITKNFSVYMHRNPDNFTRSGVAYSFTPHGLKFNDFISINIYGYSLGDLLYRYDNESYFSDCSITLVQNFNRTINSTGGTISSTDFNLNIPQNALTNPTSISVSKININCPDYASMEENYLEFSGEIDAQIIFMLLESYSNEQISSLELADYVKSWLNA